MTKQIPIGFTDVHNQPLFVGDTVHFIRYIKNENLPNGELITYLTHGDGTPDITNITDNFIFGKCAFNGLDIKEDTVNFTSVITSKNVLKLT